MASAVAVMIGGAVVNALAFTGGNFLFSKLGKTQDAEKERERHDRAVEQLEAAQAAWSQKRMQRLDFINEQMQKEHHAEQTFDDFGLKCVYSAWYKCFIDYSIFSGIRKCPSATP